MTTLEKIYNLKSLGKLRQSKCYTGFFNLADFHNAKYESEFVSPYTKGSCNVNSSIFVLLQDWASEERIISGMGEEAAIIGYTPSLPTNINLKILLKETFKCEISDVFTTNLFPYIKPGGMDASIGSRFMKEAFKEFTLPQVDIVQPRIVICCGSLVYKTAISHFQNHTNSNYNINHHFSYNGIIFIYQNHTGSRGTNSAGGIQKVKENWKFMRTLI
jgi:restriction system protein